MRISVSVERSLIDRNRFIFFYLVRFIYILCLLIATLSLFVRSLFNFAFYLASYSIVVLIFFLSFVFFSGKRLSLLSHTMGRGFRGRLQRDVQTKFSGSSRIAEATG